MERLVYLLFKVFSFLFSNFKSLWTKVSRCVHKASRRVHDIGCYEHLIDLSLWSNCNSLCTDRYA